jgi:hypothetical protein
MQVHQASFLAVVSALAAISAPCFLACSPSRSPLPPGARLEILQTEKLVLHGTAAPHPQSASCASRTRDASTRFLQLNEDTTGNFVLRPTAGVAVLHVEELATNRTWCVMTQGDGNGGTIPGEFASGIYAITVECSHSDTPTPYSVVVERM